MNQSPSTSSLPVQAPAARAAAARVGGRGTGSAHAKAILFGEHAVVYGAPAIAIPVDSLSAEAEIVPLAPGAAPGILLESTLFTGALADAPRRLAPVRAALDASLARAGLALPAARVRISSTIPHERGLGSSAAVAAAIARAAFDLAGAPLDRETLFELIQTSERVAHGSPSGIDARTVAAEGAIRFDRGAVAPVRIGAPLILACADSGTPGSTAQAVGSVQWLRRQQPERTEALLSRLAGIAEGAIADLAAGDRAAIGARMREAHGILRSVGVSSPRLDALVEAAVGAGAAGAKLTGGGLGGCVIAVADSPAHAEELGDAMRGAGAERSWTVEVPAA
ncbi:mevalonate kinase [Leucobacter allii]|uniref:Mevalonate kinase n=1 Tax=Leucobacter allii TaxID=2932247 RepID=A0ABY4FKA1_9MICO|nr:mevalonate kinase [Leucobacter allii]UOQ56778.1 mevalonate kinase [Leucobacter allii]